MKTYLSVPSVPPRDLPPEERTRLLLDPTYSKWWYRSLVDWTNTIAGLLMEGTLPPDLANTLTDAFIVYDTAPPDLWTANDYEPDEDDPGRLEDWRALHLYDDDEIGRGEAEAIAARNAGKDLPE